MNWLNVILVFVAGFGAGFLVLVGSSSRMIGNAYSMGWNDGIRHALHESVHAVQTAKQKAFGPN